MRKEKELGPFEATIDQIKWINNEKLLFHNSTGVNIVTTDNKLEFNGGFPMMRLSSFISDNGEVEALLTQRNTIYSLDFKTKDLLFLAGRDRTSYILDWSYDGLFFVELLDERSSAKARESSDNGTKLVIWNAEKKKAVQILKFNLITEDIGIEAYWHPELPVLAITGNHTVSFFEYSPDSVTSGNIFVKTASVTVNRCYYGFWSPNGNFFAVTSDEGKISVIDYTKQEISYDSSVHCKSEEEFVFVSWSPDSKYFTSYGYDNCFFVWEATKGSLERKQAVHADESVCYIEWNPVNTDLLAVYVESNEKPVNFVRIYGKNGKILKEISFKCSRDTLGDYNFFCWSPDGQKLALAMEYDHPDLEEGKLSKIDIYHLQQEVPEHQLLENNQTIYEIDIEDFFFQYPEVIEPGLRILDRQFDTKVVGIIDLLAQDQFGNIVVIELKRGKGTDKVAGQLGWYLGWVEEEFTKPVRGIIIVKEKDIKLEYAVKSLKQPVTIKIFSNQVPVINQIKYCQICGNPNHFDAKYCLKCGEKFKIV